MTVTPTPRLRAGLVGLLLTMGSAYTPAAAQSAARYNTAIGLMCPGMALKLANPPDLAPALKARPVDIEAVCRCTMKAFEADAQMQALMTGDDNLVQKRMDSPEIKSYFVLRLTRSMMGCILPEYDAALSAGPPSSASPR